VVSKRDGEIERDPRIDGSCMVILDEDGLWLRDAADRVVQMSWYLQSMGGHDTRRGLLLADGDVRALWGDVGAESARVWAGRVPPDSNQVCPAHRISKGLLVTAAVIDSKSAPGPMPPSR
jgi:hypothetical protein